MAGTIKFFDEMQNASNVSGQDRMMIGKAESGETQVVTFDQAKQYLDITSNEIAPIIGGDSEANATPVPAGPSGQTRRADVAPGWLDFGDGPIEAPSTNRWLAYWDGTTWSLVDMGPIPQAINKILNWETGFYTFGDQRLHKGQLWSVVVSSTTDEPGVGSGWGLELDALKQSDLRYTYSPVWEQGSIVGTTGEDTDSTNPVYPNRVRTQAFLESDSEIYVTTQAGQEIIVYYYDDNGDFISNTGFQQSPFSTQYQGLFRVAIRKSNPNEPFVPSENTAKILSGNKFLTKEEGDLKANLGQLELLESSIYEGIRRPLFTNGSIDPNNGNDQNVGPVFDATRLRCENILVSGRINVETSEEQEAAIFIYDDYGVFVSFSGFRTKHTDVNVTHFLRLVVRNKDNSNITPQDNTVLIYDKALFATKDELSDIENAVFIYEDPILPVEQGLFGTNNGSNQSSTQYCRTPFIEADYIESISVDVNQSLSVLWYKNSSLVARTGYADSHTDIDIPDDCQFRVAIRYKASGVPLTPEEVTLQCRTRRLRSSGGNDDNGGGDDDNNVFKTFQPPMFSTAPLGETLGYPLAEKQDLFEQIVGDYPAELTKELIGTAFNGVNEIYAYTLTPPEYTVTIAVTSHVHGNEKYNPTGFFALLSLITESDIKHDFLKWIKNNVRWIMVPFVSPIGYIGNNRYTNGVNLNRNMDYDWGNITDGTRGPSPMSMPENQNIQNYFMPLRDEIDFHIDTHDIPSQAGISYWMWQNKDFIWLEEQDFVETWLVNLNETNKMTSRYKAVGGSYTQYFTEILGIPSVTPEHSTLFWIDQPVDVQIAKASEQTSALVCMFANLHEQRRGSPFYNKLVDRSFCSEQFGISTWSYNELESYLSSLGQWVPEPESGDVVSYILEPTSYDKTILVLAGATPDDKNSCFTAKAFMEELIRDESKMPMYVRDLKKARIIVMPIINGKAGFVPEENLESIVVGAQIKYSPDYTLVIRGVPNDQDPDNIAVRSSSTSYLTRWTKTNIDNILLGSEGIENYITGRYSVAILNNHIEESFKYANGVVKWMELVTNDVASFNKKINT